MRYIPDRVRNGFMNKPTLILGAAAVVFGLGAGAFTVVASGDRTWAGSAKSSEITDPQHAAQSAIEADNKTDAAQNAENIAKIFEIGALAMGVSCVVSGSVGVAMAGRRENDI